MQVSNHTWPRNLGVLVIGMLLVVVALVAGGAEWQSRTLQTRQTDVATRGAAVMPFDLERTTHMFRKGTDGGVQQVTADDPADAAQIALIHSHLVATAANFRQGNFDDPMAIHGHTMPGVATLRTAYAQIAIIYTELPAGGEIRYTTTDPVVISALHDWFDAQLMDHGNHAVDH